MSGLVEQSPRAQPVALLVPIGCRGSTVNIMPMVVAAVVLIAAEVFVLIEVAKAIGVAPAILALLVISASGPWLVRRAGFGVWRRTRERLAAGEFPGREALDGVVLLAGGLLVCIPGFITDVFGLLLLVPPVRSLAGRVLEGRLARRGVRMVTTRGRGPDGQVVDVDSHPGGRPIQPGDSPAE